MTENANGRPLKWETQKEERAVEGGKHVCMSGNVCREVNDTLPPKNNDNDTDQCASLLAKRLALAIASHACLPIVTAREIHSVNSAH